MPWIFYTVLPEEAGCTVRDVLTGALGVSSTLRKALMGREGAVLVAGRAAPLWQRLASGETVAVDVSDPPAPPPKAVDFPLSVLWEDEHLLAIDKPPGIAVHAAALTEEAVTVAGAAAWHTGGPVHIVNRLDRGTTGVMLLAKNGYMHARCMALLHSGDLQREYRAVCDGVPQPEQGTVDAPIGREEGSLLRRCVAPGGQRAVTEYRLLAKGQGRSLLGLRPVTGRTHQLRVHMASLGCPLTGDWLYGAEDRALIPRPALHSHILRLTHPLTGETLTVTAPLPEDMVNLV